MVIESLWKEGDLVINKAKALVNKLRGVEDHRSTCIHHGDQRSLYRTRFNDLFWLDKNSYVDQCIINSGIFEPQSTNIVKQILKPGDTVLDIGANIGYYSVLMSRCVSDDGKVICFEPTRHYRDVLLQNLEANNISNCQVLEYGVSEANQSLSINIGVHSATLHWIGDEKPVDTEVILLKRLDDVIASLKIDKIDFVKIDVDGHEPACLAGAWETISRYDPVILLEVSHPNYLNYGVTAWDFYDLLKEKHFHIYSEEALEEFRSRDEFLFKCGNFAYSANIFISRKALR